LGSVAERIIQRAETPIFLVRGPAIAPSDNWQRILAPLDGSSLAEQALKPAIALAKMFNSQLILLQAVAELDVESQRILFPTPMAAEEAMTSWQAAAEEYLRSITKTLQERDGLNASYQAIVGEAGQVIATTVANSQIDLIVMSTHGRTGWQRWVYGSVANKVLRSAECPILLVRACPQQ
jgi:nucleotide-binding universal stress UspA family protein